MLPFSFEFTDTLKRSIVSETKRRLYNKVGPLTRSEGSRLSFVFVVEAISELDPVEGSAQDAGERGSHQAPGDSGLGNAAREEIDVRHVAAGKIALLDSRRVPLTYPMSSLLTVTKCSFKLVNNQTTDRSIKKPTL